MVVAGLLSAEFAHFGTNTADNRKQLRSVEAVSNYADAEAAIL